MSEAKPQEPQRKARGVVFLTSPPAHARRALEEVRNRHPNMPIAVYVRESDRDALGSVLDSFEVRSDKPRGGKLRFLREIRKAGFEVAFACWEGDPSYNRMKLVHLLSGVDKKIVFNPNAKSFRLQMDKDPVWLKHVRWRMSSNAGPRISNPMDRFTGMYRNVFGWWLGSLWTALRFQSMRLGRRSA